MKDVRVWCPVCGTEDARWCPEGWYCGRTGEPVDIVCCPECGMHLASELTVEYDGAYICEGCLLKHEAEYHDQQMLKILDECMDEVRNPCTDIKKREFAVREIVRYETRLERIEELEELAGQDLKTDLPMERYELAMAAFAWCYVRREQLSAQLT